MIVDSSDSHRQNELKHPKSQYDKNEHKHIFGCIVCVSMVFFFHLGWQTHHYVRVCKPSDTSEEKQKQWKFGWQHDLVTEKSLYNVHAYFQLFISTLVLVFNH